jgi:hypothetical protein
MSAKKSNQEKIEELERKIQANKATINRLKNMEKEKERKARTKRLIESGAVLESVLQLQITHEDLPALEEALRLLEENPKAPYWLSNAIRKGRK